jgi:formate/nitrite transporter FocA (FNT family)
LEIVHGASLSAFVKSVLAGWLIALMVWMLPSARSARLFVILLLTYVVALGHFPHIVAGSVEAAFAVFAGEAQVTDYLGGFLLPTLIGNTLGGVALAALLNHAPLADELG